MGERAGEEEGCDDDEEDGEAADGDRVGGFGVAVETDGIKPDEEAKDAHDLGGFSGTERKGVLVGG